MKHFAKFTTVLMAAFMAISMIGFTSCNDEVNDNFVDLRTSLEDEIRDLDRQLNDLENQVNQINSCTCDFNKVINLVRDSLANYWNASQTQGYVDNALANYWDINQVQNFVNTELNNYVQKTVYEAMIDSVRGALADAREDINNNRDDIDSLALVTINLNNAIAQANALANAANQLAKNDSMRIDTLTLHVINIENLVYQAIDSAAAAWAFAWRDSIRIHDLEQTYEVLSQTISNMQAKDNAMQTSIDSIKTALLDFATHAEVNAVLDSARLFYSEALHYSDSLYTLASDSIGRLDVRVTTLETTVGVLSAAVATLQAEVIALQVEISALKTQVDKNTQDIADLTATVNDVFSKQIYSVVLNGSYNPVFGYFALPMGIQSNVLLSYYGENEHITYFPTVSTSDLVYEQYALTAADAAMLGGSVDAWSIAGQTTFVGDSANAGKLYLTINPSTADLTDAEFTLVNSLDEESPIKLDSLTPCTEKLTFGYTKAPAIGAATNGFYQATATLAEADIEDAKIHVDANLKSFVKDFYNKISAADKSVSGARNLVGNLSYSELASGLYNQMNGFLPAYAVKATWTDSLGTHSTYSNYGVAAAAVKPLSYAFLKDMNLGRLPNITPMSDINFNMGSIDIDFSAINFHIDDVDPNISFSFHIVFDQLDISQYGDVIAKVKMPKTYSYNPITGKISADPIDENDPSTYELQNIDLSDYETWAENLANDVNQKIGDMANNIETQVQNELINKFQNQLKSELNNIIHSINNKVESMVGQIGGKLETSVNGVLNDVNNQLSSNVNKYINTLNKIIGKLNSAINRANTLLNNVNKFLQPLLVFEGNDGTFHMMSTDKNFPSVFTGSGAIELYPTSYNAEIAAPAYKKFVAVTNVYKNGASAQGGDAACTSALNTANSQGLFNQVINGNILTVGFVGQAGYTYEIFYSALDYSGKISQRKYYVTVK